MIESEKSIVQIDSNPSINKVILELLKVKKNLALFQWGNNSALFVSKALRARLCGAGIVLPAGPSTILYPTGNDKDDITISISGKINYFKGDHSMNSSDGDVFMLYDKVISDNEIQSIVNSLEKIESEAKMAVSSWQV